MAIYRGTQPVAPSRGDWTPARVYRGSRLVWELVPPWAGASGAIGSYAPPRGQLTVATFVVGDGVDTTADYSLEIRWTSNNGVFNQLFILRNGTEIGGRTISGSAVQTHNVTGLIATGDVISFVALANSYNAAERHITSGSWNIVPA